jgi:iron(III) transport system substrate-binding protein
LENKERIFLRKYLAFGTALLALVAVAGCSTSSNSEAKSLTIYSGRSEEFIGPFLEQFSQESGYELNVRYGDSAELAAQILEEGSNSPADIFISQDAGALGAVSEQGLLATLSAQIPSKLPTEFISEDKTWVGLTGRARVFVYNPTTLVAIPNTIDDLGNAKFIPPVGIAPTNASFQSFVTAVRNARGDEATKQWLTALKFNSRIYEKNSQIVEAVEAGEIQLGLVNHYYVWEISQELGKELKAKNGFFADGDLGNLINVSGAGVFKTAKNPAGANALIEYLLTEKIQEQFVQQTYEYSVLTGINPPKGLPALGETGAPVVDLNSLKDLAATQRLLVEVGLL